MAETPEDSGKEPPSDRSIPESPMKLTLENSEKLVLENIEEGGLRKGTFVVPQATLPENFVLPSAAPIIENPAVYVEQPPQPSDQSQSDE